MRPLKNLIKSKLLAVAAVAGFVLTMSPPPASAEVPTKFNFQGRLVEPSTEDPLDGSFDMVFRICDHLSNACTGGSKLWEESQTISIDNGVFEAVFGSVVAVDSSVFTGPAYLEIEVETEALSPRQEIVPQPLALRASIADDLVAGDSDYIHLIDTLQLGATFYVSSATVNGQLTVGGELRLIGQLTADGVIVAGSGSNQITTAAGLLDTSKLDPTQSVPTAVIDPSSVAKFNAGGFIPNDHLDSSSFTKLGNSFGGANQLFLLDGSGNVPSANLESSSVTKQGNSINGPGSLTLLDGNTLLENFVIDPSSVSKFNAAGDIPNDHLDSSSITKQGNAVNVANGLLRLDANAAIDISAAGSAIYSVTTSSSVNVTGTGAKVRENGSDLVPSGAIILWNKSSTCPNGYSENTSFRGFLPMGLPAGGTLNGTVGTALTDLQTMTHSHDGLAVTGLMRNGNNRQTDSQDTTQPYIQILFCEKN